MRRRLFSGLAALCALHWLSSASALAAQFTELQSTFSSGDARFVTPAPPYPFLVYGDTHQWTAFVAFNERGDASEAVLVRSTGNAQLDNLIIKWIQTHWKSSGGKPAKLVTSGK